MNKQDIEKQEEQGLIALVDQSGVELAIDKLIGKNNSLLPNNIVIDKIKNSAGFYISNRDDLMALPPKEKLSMLYGVLKEAMVGCEAGIDYDIVPFKNKAVICRKKEGWFKVLDLIKPAEIVRFTSNVILKDDKYKFNPVTEELVHEMITTSDKYEDIVASYAYIKFANGFEKTVFLTKKDLDAIKKVSPSASSSYSPWTTQTMKMVKTKTVKELAKELFTLFSGRVNSAIAKAVDIDEQAIKRVDEKGNIIEDGTVYEIKNIETQPVEEKEVNITEL